MPRFLALLAAVALAGLARPALGHAAPTRFDVGIQDPVQFPEQDPAGAYRTARSEGVRFVRLPVNWHDVARSRPNDPTNPNDPHYSWEEVDGRLASIRAEGMTPLFLVSQAPEWAHGSRLTAPVSDFGDFVTAAARRYNGVAAPRVRYWQMWNEPNLRMFLDDSAAHYRAMVNAGYKAVKAAHSDNIVIAGGLAPFSDPTNQYGIAPFPYMRSVLCMSEGTHPHPTCGAKTSFDIWAHHPYTSGGPNHSAALPQEASLGDLPEMHRLLAAARRAGHVRSRGSPGFWVTEFGWDTKPPDPGGVPVARHARWVAEAMYRMWQADVSMMVWFKLRDDLFNGDWGAGLQGGIYFNTTALYADEQAKPAADVLRFPFVAVPESRRVSVWGRTPRSRGGKVAIDLRQGAGWTRIATIRANGHGLFRVVLDGRRGATLRARVAGAAPSRPFQATNTTDVPVRPFGGP
jgi:Cellulase (glycosyl hydrolase family 5)